MKRAYTKRIFALLSVSIVILSMLGSLAVQTGADSTGDFVPIKWAVIITGGFDYYRTGWYWSYNTIQRLENYMQGRGVPYDLISDSDLESARDTPSPGKYPLQFADGTIRYQTIVLQTNSYSSVEVANKDIILQAVASGTNAVLFGKALKAFPELFGLNPEEVLSDNWPTATFLTVKVTKAFDDGVVNGNYMAGTQISMGAQTARVECTTLNNNGKTVWFNFLRNGDWAIGMMNSTYGDGAVWFNTYDMTEPALEYTSQLNSAWVDNNMGFWAHTINFVLNSAEKISVHIMPFETWKGSWILRTDRDFISWRPPPPVEAFEAGWKWLEGFCVLGYGRVPNGPVTLTPGLPSNYVWSPSEKVMWADLCGVPKNDQARTLVTYKMIVYNSTIGGSYDRIRIDFNNDSDFSDDAEYKVWDDITYPDIIGTLFWCYISPDFANPTSIGLGWKQTPILFEDDALTALREVGENYGNLYTFHSFYHFDVGYDYRNGGFLKWDGTEFVQDPEYVRERFEAARASIIQDFDATGYGFESDNVVLHYSGNIYPMWVREVVGQIPWILYEIGHGSGPGGFYKASETTKWMLPCYGSEAYETFWPTYVEAIQTLYPFMAVFQHADLYNLSFNQTQMRPYTNDIKIANAIDVYNFFINSRTMLQNFTAAYYQNGQVVLDFNAPSALVHYTWVLPSTINGNEYVGFSDSANVAALKSNDGQNIFIESSEGQGHQILTVNYNPASPKVTVTVSGASGGTTSPVAGQYQVSQNSVFAVSVTASSGYAFDYWTLDEENVGSANPYSFNVGTTDHAISPVFEAVPTVNVVVSSASGGTTSPVAGQYSVSINSVFTVSATASSGYAFDHWVVDGASVGSANPYSFNVGTTDHTIDATFVVAAISAQIASCDSLTSWSFPYASGSVDTQDFKEGTGSIAVSPTGSPWVMYANLQPSTKMNFASYSKLEIWIKASDSTKQLQLMVATDWSNYNWYTITGLTSNVWTKATIDLSAPTSKTGTGNFNSISFIRFSYSNARAVVSLKIDDIRGTHVPTVNVVVSSASGGTTSPVAGQYSVSINSVFTVSATASSGYAFDYWTLDEENVGSANPYSFNVGTTDHTITPIFIQLVSAQIASCDSLTSWSFPYASGSVDTQDFKEGTGSIAVSPMANRWVFYADLQPSTKMNFASYSKLEMWLKVSDSTKQLQLMVATDWNNYNVYTITGLVSNGWVKITIDLSTPTTSTGTVDFNSISFIRFSYSNALASESLKIDDIRGIF